MRIKLLKKDYVDKINNEFVEMEDPVLRYTDSGRTTINVYKENHGLYGGETILFVNCMNDSMYDATNRYFSEERTVTYVDADNFTIEAFPDYRVYISDTNDIHMHDGYEITSKAYTSSYPEGSNYLLLTTSEPHNIYMERHITISETNANHEYHDRKIKEYLDTKDDIGNPIVPVCYDENNKRYILLNEAYTDEGFVHDDNMNRLPENGMFLHEARPLVMRGDDEDSIEYIDGNDIEGGMANAHSVVYDSYMPFGTDYLNTEARLYYYDIAKDKKVYIGGEFPDDIKNDTPVDRNGRLIVPCTKYGYDSRRTLLWEYDKEDGDHSVIYYKLKHRYSDISLYAVDERFFTEEFAWFDTDEKGNAIGLHEGEVNIKPSWKCEGKYIADKRIICLSTLNLILNTRVDGEFENMCNTVIKHKRSNINIELPLATDFATNLHTNYLLEEIFANEEAEKTKTKVIDYEKVVFEPYYIPEDYVSGSDIDEVMKPVGSITYKLHFIERTPNTEGELGDDGYQTIFTEDGTPDYGEWMVNDGSTWSKSTIDPVNKLGDPLGFLGFSDNDILYQKSKLRNSFLRNIVYDDIRSATQVVYTYNTMFTDTSDLYNKLIKLKNTKGLSPTASEYDNYCYVQYNDDKRLDCSFTCTNKYVTDKSSDGFYLYMYPSVCSGTSQTQMYMANTYNHAKYGVVIPMSPNKITTVDGSRQKLYQKITVKYNKLLNKYVWLFTGLTSKTNDIVIDLWEPSINMKTIDDAYKAGGSSSARANVAPRMMARGISMLADEPSESESANAPTSIADRDVPGIYTGPLIIDMDSDDYDTSWNFGNTSSNNGSTNGGSSSGGNTGSTDSVEPNRDRNRRGKVIATYSDNTKEVKEYSPWSTTGLIKCNHYDFTKDDPDKGRYMVKLEVINNVDVLEWGSTGTPQRSQLKELVIYEGNNGLVIERFMCMPSLEKVTIANGPVELGSHAFYECTKLKEIEIPGSVKKINGYAFAYCENLSSITFNEGLEELNGNEMFRGCAIKEIVFPDSLKNLDDLAFTQCKNLEKVTIGRGMKDFGQACFRFCENLKTIVIRGGMEDRQFRSDTFQQIAYSGVVYHDEGVDVSEMLSTAKDFLGYYGWTCSCGDCYADPLHKRPFTLEIEKESGDIYDYYWPTGTVDRCMSPYGTHLSKVVIGTDMINVGQCAYGWINTNTFDIYEFEIYEQAKNFYFLSLGANNLRKITCYGMKEPSTKYGPFSATLLDNGEQGELIYPSGGDYTEWKNELGGLAKWKISTLSDVEAEKHKHDAGGVKITYTDGTSEIFTDLPYGVITPKRFDRAFLDGDKEIMEVEVLEGTKTIGNYAFQGNHYFTTIKIPASVTIIRQNAFTDCPELEHVTISDKNQKYQVGGGGKGIIRNKHFLYPNTPSLINGEYIYHIFKNAVLPTDRNATKPTDSDLMSIEEYAFRSNCVYDEFVIPSGVKWIRRYAFRNAKVRKVKGGVFWGIFDYAFADNDMLEEVSIVSIGTDNNAWKQINMGLFYNCPNLKKFNVPSGVEKIGMFSFEKSGIEEITIPESVTSVWKAFIDTPNLRKINFRGTIEQWKAVNKHDDMKYTAHDNLVVECSDGICESW